MSTPKGTLRDQFKQLRSQVTPGMAESSALGVWSILSKRPEFEKAKTIAGFASVGTEINTYPLLEGALKLGKRLCLPRLAKEKDHFFFYPVQDLKDLTPGAFGIFEPAAGKHIEWEELDLVLVPGLAFDDAGNRLGFGKGYYDRALPHLKPSALTIGLGYSFQMVPDLPAETHDVKVKALLNEKGFHPCKSV